MSATKPCDQHQRHQALDPGASFIVQAPAGSGKTELLVQRYLVLLTQVCDPEEVVAMTFTRKAAVEMRTRVLSSLKTVGEQVDPNKNEGYQRWQLAKKLLQHQTRRGWDLLAQSHRLRIQTIDAFNAYLCRQMPISSGLAATTTISEAPESFYRLAIQALFRSLTQKVTWHPTLTPLLLHLGNDYSQTEDLLIGLLARRDQWLAYIPAQPHPDSVRHCLEQGLQRVRSDLVKMLNTLPASLRQELLSLINFVRQQRHQEAIPTTDSEAFWSDCLPLLLTKKGQWRKTVTAKQGFPSLQSNGDLSPAQVIVMKKRMKRLLARLVSEDSWRALLAQWQLAPPPTYTEAQWVVLKALFQLLPALVEHLQSVFQHYNAVDYVEVSLRALQVVLPPTDLVVALDYPVKHILVDEFQDTSVVQFHLLSQLTAAWKPFDGHSLFLVGDPMQSIYRFRKAEVSLFNQVRQHGLGQIKLRPLTLQCNFRSMAGIVDWVNASFTSLLPRHEPNNLLGLSFTTSATQSLTHSGSTVHWHWLIDSSDQQEAQTVVTLVKAAFEKNPRARVAVLVRARSHLPLILEKLRLAGVCYQALEISNLAEKPIIQDLLALTRALLHLADDTAWLAVLRAPWIGLSLQELHCLTRVKQDLVSVGTQPSTGITIWDRLLDFEQLGLMPAAQQRINRALPTLRRAIQQQGREPLVQRIKMAWLSLAGPACLESVEANVDVQTFFDLLGHLQVGEDIVDTHQLEARLGSLYASTSEVSTHSVEVMTIHKAKGLEFDTVILAGLHRLLRSGGPQLLLYRERPRAENPPDLLFAPIKASHEEQDAIYNYLQYEEKQAEEQETLRLLYVATTRARFTLHLLACLERDAQGHYKKPATNSLLAVLWPVLLPILPSPTSCAQPVSNTTTPTSSAKWLKRLSLDWQHPWACKTRPDLDETRCVDEESSTNFSRRGVDAAVNELGTGSLPSYHQSDHYAQTIGRVIHRLLCQISRDGLTAWSVEAVASRRPSLRCLLLQIGLRSIAVDTAVTVVQTSLQRTLADPRGRWILSNEHQAAQSEYALSGYIDGKIQQMIIDRTFIDDSNIRWVIDYKTATYVGDDLDSFLIAQRQQHCSKLEHYAKLIQLLYPHHKVRLGLYFPLSTLWHEWEFLP